MRKETKVSIEITMSSCGYWTSVQLAVFKVLFLSLCVCVCHTDLSTWWHHQRCSNCRQRESIRLSPCDFIPAEALHLEVFWTGLWPAVFMNIYAVCSSFCFHWVCAQMKSSFSPVLLALIPSCSMTCTRSCVHLFSLLNHAMDCSWEHQLNQPDAAMN